MRLQLCYIGKGEGEFNTLLNIIKIIREIFFKKKNKNYKIKNPPPKKKKKKKKKKTMIPLYFPAQTISPNLSNCRFQSTKQMTSD
jgi:hypothetical protein